MYPVVLDRCLASSLILDLPHFGSASSEFAGRRSAGLFFFVALRPKSTAMVMAGRSVHITTLFHGQA